MSESVRGQCAWVGCADPSEAEIVGRPLCSNHFYLVAQRRLSALLGLLSDDDADRTLPPDVQRFLSELVSETATLTSQSQRLTPERLEELLKLSVKAVELHQKIQRPLRLRRRIPITVSVDAHGETKEQESTTVNVGGRGACIETNLRLQSGQVIWVERRNIKGKARARVAWVRSLPGGLILAGIALMDATDFWGLETANATGQAPASKG